MSKLQESLGCFTARRVSKGHHGDTIGTPLKQAKSVAILSLFVYRDTRDTILDPRGAFY
jgi:hypothetical protein